MVPSIKRQDTKYHEDLTPGARRGTLCLHARVFRAMRGLLDTVSTSLPLSEMYCMTLNKCFCSVFICNMPKYEWRNQCLS
jgi:hypothetical protein